MLHALRPRTWFLVAAAGLLGAAGIAYSSLWFCAPLGLSLFFYALWARPARWQALLGYGWLYGSLTGAAAIAWFLDAYPIQRLGIENLFVGYLLVASTWLLIALVLGSAVAFGALVLVRVRMLPDRLSFLWPLGAAITWMLIEQMRMLAFALFTWAPQSYFGANFSVASVGYALAAQPYLLQLAHPLGVAALDFSAALAAATFACGIPLAVRTSAARKKRSASSLLKTRAAFLGGAVLSVGVFALPACFPYHPAPATSTLHVDLVTADLPPEQFDTAHAVRALLAQVAQDTSAQVIAFPEAYGVGGAFPGSAATTTLARSFGTRDVLVLSSAPAAREGALERLTYLRTAPGTVASYIKVFLVPVGEYEPLVFAAYYSLFNSPQFNSYLQYLGTSGTPGTAYGAYTYAGARLYGMLCSDLISPTLYGAGAKDARAQMLVVLSNYSWFHTSPRLFDKMLEIAKVAAVEDRRPLVLANNGAPAYALDERGTVLAMTPWHFTGVLPVTIPVRP